jgi:hypothetical protein
MKRMSLLAILGILLAAPAYAQTGIWRDAGGKPMAESDSTKSKGDFAGSLLAVTDEAWQAKWNTPPENHPSFTQAGTVPLGKKVFILTFFSNALNDSQGKVNVGCDLKISAPTGKVSLDQKGVTCFAGKIGGSPYALYLSAPVVTFTGDADDPPGTWLIEVNLRDENRHVELPLRTTFQLQGAPKEVSP